ncbi:MAG: AAA family ATPase [Candidatus Uhrbacteria bacterium]
MPKLIIGLVGQAGCGKGTVTDLLKSKYGAGYIRFSGLLEQIVQILGIEKTRDNYIKISTGLREKLGEDILSYAVERYALNAPEDIIVVDGIRRIDDIVALEPLPQFKLLAISAPAELRFERMKKRGEKASESNMTWEQFEKEEHAPTEIAIPSVMDRAWRTLDNAGDKEEFENLVKKTLHDLGFEPLPE